MRDLYGDRVQVFTGPAGDFPGLALFLEVEESHGPGGFMAQAALSRRQARKLAKRIRKMADSLEPAERGLRG